MATIPQPKKHDEAAKKQHLIPRCYVKPWYIGSSESIWAYNKKEKYHSGVNSEWDIERRNIERILQINGFHDIKAGSLCMPEDAEHEIFDDILQFDVTCNGKKLKTALEWSLAYSDFNQWIIKDTNGVTFTPDEKAALKEYLDNTRWVYIETEWSKAYENQWHDFINQIESQAKALSFGKRQIGKTPQDISQDEFKKLIKYSVVFDWRSLEGNEIFNEIQEVFYRLMPLGTINIPEGERIHKEDKTAEDEIRHNLILQAFTRYLQNDSGWMKTIETFCVSNCSLSIWLTDLNHPFITSDNPSFSEKKSDGKQRNYFVALPTMLISYESGNPNEYTINCAAPDQVLDLNKKIAQNGQLLIVQSDAYNIKCLF